MRDILFGGGQSLTISEVACAFGQLRRVNLDELGNPGTGLEDVAAATKVVYQGAGCLNISIHTRVGSMFSSAGSLA
jgi:hypothetical protein